MAPPATADALPPRRPISAQLVARAAQMRAAGASLRSCALRFDVAESALGKRLRRLQRSTRRDLPGAPETHRRRRRRKENATTTRHSDADDGDNEHEEDDDDSGGPEWRVALAPPPLPLEPRPWWSPFELVMSGGGWAFPTASSLTTATSVAEVVVTTKPEYEPTATTTTDAAPPDPSPSTKTWQPTDLLASGSGAWAVVSSPFAASTAVASEPTPDPKPDEDAPEVETDSATLSSAPPSTSSSPSSSRSSSTPTALLSRSVQEPQLTTTTTIRTTEMTTKSRVAPADAQTRASWNPLSLLKYQLRQANPRRLEKLQIAFPSQSERRWSF